MSTNANGTEKNKCSPTSNSHGEFESAFVGRVDSCHISTEAMTHIRRCFMSGEYCSQQTNIQRERKELYNQTSITAFVIMNFSDMSDVLYKWRIEPFIKSLSKYLYLDKEDCNLYCSDEKSDAELKKKGLKRIRNIKVVRADSDPASNYAICSRICQQMQIADLVVVDVSWKNANVFYEFGMAVALQKLILPICYSESFYKMDVPAVAKSDIKIKEKIEHHIGCYPWRKDLFEYYGIRYKQKDKAENAGTRYVPLSELKKPLEECSGKRRAIDEFSDIRYIEFPYDVCLNPNGQENIGALIYENLQKQYNCAKVQDNTLVVYTMEGFLNEDEAWLCIVNFYHSITEMMKNEHCFEGDRVGVLVQPNAIPESDKDTEQQRNVDYGIGEIIRIGVNQATYSTTRDKVTAEDVFSISQKLKNDYSIAYDEAYERRILRFIKEHISNKSMIIYPQYPVYVQRAKELLPDMVPDPPSSYPEDIFTLYHVMLKTLRYTNEIVVDITANCIQSLFWLGAAHASEIDAITVRHAVTDKEMAANADSRPFRKVFDVAGLWTAVHYTHNTEGFYHQLTLAQYGIERHSKLITSDAMWRKLRKWEYLESEEEEEKYPESKAALESYYRRRFWQVMLRYNRLSIYLPQHDDTVKTSLEKDSYSPYDEPRVRVARWDMDAVSALTHYLSKRSIIGEYVVVTVPENQNYGHIANSNFICVGNPMKLQEEAFTEHIKKFLSVPSFLASAADGLNKIHIPNLPYEPVPFDGCKKGKIQIKGFRYTGDTNMFPGIFTQHPWPECGECECTSESSDHESKSEGNKDVIDDIGKLRSEDGCPLADRRSHTEIAQLILWREDNKGRNSHFRMSLVGSSGPATYGLSSLFVDRDQKLYNFLNKRENRDREGIDGTLLYDLQKAVRGKVMELLLERIKNSMNVSCDQLKAEYWNGNAHKNGERVIVLEESDMENLKNHLLHAISNYLSTVLYRYFLPFLSEKDMNRIRNGVYLFVRRLNAAAVHSLFGVGILKKEKEDGKYWFSDNDILMITKEIPQTVRKMLEDFKGLETFYKVTVRHAPQKEAKEANVSSPNIKASGVQTDKDNRKVTKVVELDKNYATTNLFVQNG